MLRSATPSRASATSSNISLSFLLLTPRFLSPSFRAWRVAMLHSGSPALAFGLVPVVLSRRSVVFALLLLFAALHVGSSSPWITCRRFRFPRGLSSVPVVGPPLAGSRDLLGGV